jgi:hypothetical protein
MLWKESSCDTTAVVEKKVAPICQQDWLCPGGWRSLIPVLATQTTAESWLWSLSKHFERTPAVDQKKVAPICQQDWLCPGGWKPFNGHCYLMVKNATNGNNAEKDCNSKGGHLAPRHSAAENTFIFNLLSGSSYLWIGGTDAAVDVVTHIVACANPCSYVCEL